MDKNTRDVMFSSAKTGTGKDEWGTPQDLFDKLNKEFHFDVDVCALPENAKCDKYFTPDDNGLEQPWIGDVWMNPPYSESADWLKKAYEESLKGSRVVALIPSRTDTRVFGETCMKAEEIRFVKGRLKFGDSNQAAPFPSMLVVFNDNGQTVPEISVYDPKSTEPIEEKRRKVLYYEERID